MLPNAQAPTTGADSTRLAAKQWQVYILRDPQWVPCGVFYERPLAETHANTLRRLMPRHRFAVVFGADPNAA